MFVWIDLGFTSLLVSDSTFALGRRPAWMTRALSIDLRVRAMKPDDRPVLLWMSMEPAGHGGRTSLGDVTKDDAKSLSWMLGQWGISQ